MLLVVLAAPGCSASLDRSFEYALSINTYELSEAELGRALDLAQDAGVNTVTTGASWWYIAPEPSPERYRWTPLDRLVEEAGRRGLKVRLQVGGTPDWVHPNLKDIVQDHSLRIWHPPEGREELEHFADFVGILVERYGSRVESYEMWNEPNHDEFWRPFPDPAAYAALLRAGYLSAKSAYPDASVAFGGLSRNDVGYLNAYYSEAKKYPDATANNYFFDVMDVHPYSSVPSATGGLQEPISPDRYTADAVSEGDYGEVDQNFLGVKKMKSAMDEQGDTGKQIYLGEYGFSTDDTWMKAVPDYRRALYLKRAYTLARDLQYVKGINWYSYVPGNSVGEEWTMVNRDLVPTLTYRALAQTTGAENTEVAVRISLSEEPVSETYPIVPDLSGISETDVSGWELYIDGGLAGSYKEIPLEWDTRQVADGIHSLMVVMYAKDGSVWSSDPLPVEVRNAPEGLIDALRDLIGAISLVNHGGNSFASLWA